MGNRYCEDQRGFSTKWCSHFGRNHQRPRATGLDLFDSRGRQDIERLAAYLQRPESAGRRVVLVGFADPQPKAPMQALFLSQERADYVSSELLALNLKVVAVRGLGGRMSLVDGAQPAARYRNDRVEVWLR